MPSSVKTEVTELWNVLEVTELCVHQRIVWRPRAVKTEVTELWSVWAGLAKRKGVRLVNRGTWVRIRLGSPFSSRTLWTLFCDFVPHNYETLKWLSSLPTVMQKSFWWWQCSDRYIISLSPHLRTHFSPSLISLMVSVGVKHHVYLLTVKCTRSDRAVKCTRSGRAMKCTRSDKAVKCIRSDKAVKCTRSDRAVKCTRSDRAVRRTRSDRAVKCTRSDRAVKCTRSDRAVMRTRSDRAVCTHQPTVADPVTRVHVRHGRAPCVL